MARAKDHRAQHLRADFDTDADGRFTRFAVTQSGAKPGAGEARVHRLAVGVYDDDGAGKLVLVNDDELTYCSLRLDSESLQTALTRIADINELLPRTLVWSAAREMTREAELKARDFVAMVSAGVQGEIAVAAVQELLANAAGALACYADPQWAREEGWPAFACRLLELARSAGPGSDHQLGYINALCASVLSPRHTEVLSALLDVDPAEQGLSGLTVDTDLRWRIVTALEHTLTQNL